MIGNLLKQLFKALGISIRHHLSHLFGRREPSLPNTAQSESGLSLALEVPEITTMIKEIRIFDSMVAIYKTRRPHAPRYIVA